MHFSTVVILPKDKEVSVETLLAPYDENGEWFKDGSRWDWWMVGGRWDGEMLGLPWQGLKQQCSFCEGTGVSKYATKQEDGSYHHVFVGGSEADYPYGCHVCQGSGQEDAWTTNPAYSTPERNECLGKDVSPDFEPYAFITPDGQWNEAARMGWFGTIDNEEGTEPIDEEDWSKVWDEAKKTYADYKFVLVDCHV